MIIQATDLQDAQDLTYGVVRVSEGTCALTTRLPLTTGEPLR